MEFPPVAGNVPVDSTSLSVSVAAVTVTESSPSADIALVSDNWNDRVATPEKPLAGVNSTLPFFTVQVPCFVFTDVAHVFVFGLYNFSELLSHVAPAEGVPFTDGVNVTFLPPSLVADWSVTDGFE